MFDAAAFSDPTAMAKGLASAIVAQSRLAPPPDMKPFPIQSSFRPNGTQVGRTAPYSPTPTPTSTPSKVPISPTPQLSPASGPSGRPNFDRVLTRTNPAKAPNSRPMIRTSFSDYTGKSMGSPSGHLARVKGFKS